MKKRKFAGILAAMLLLLALSPAAYAEETEATEETEETVEKIETPSSKQTSGTCGDGLTWEFSGTTLTITGSGEMAEGASWAGQDRIKTVILTGGVTTVAAGAFEDCENLTAVDFGDSLKEIHEGAFRDCTGLTAISLPKTFRLFGAESFYGCTGLETIHCAGGMPSFKSSCLWTGNYITIYYPTNNPWPAESMQILADNFGGRLEMIAASSDTPQPPVVRAETVPVETEPATVPTTAPTLPPETVPVVTTEATVPETTQAAETTEAVVYTLPTMATQPVETEEPETESLSGGIIAVILIVAVLTFFIVGALIARSLSRRRYE